jgi:hypothetical protein
MIEWGGKYHRQSHMFNMTRLGTKKTDILPRCNIFNNMTTWTSCHNNELFHENAHYKFLPHIQNR